MPYPQCCETVGCSVYSLAASGSLDASESSILDNDWNISDSSTWAFKKYPVDSVPEHHTYDLQAVCSSDSPLENCNDLQSNHSEEDKSRYLWNSDTSNNATYPRLSNLAHDGTSNTSIIISKNIGNTEYNVLSGNISFANIDNQVKVYFNYANDENYWYVQFENIASSDGSDLRTAYNSRQWKVSLYKRIADEETEIEVKESLYAEEPLGYRTLFNGETIYQAGLAGNANSGRHYHIPFQIAISKPSWFNDYDSNDDECIISVKTDFCHLVCKDEKTSGKAFGFETSGTIAAPSETEFNSDIIISSIKYTSHKDSTTVNQDGCRSEEDCISCKQWWDKDETTYLLSVDGKDNDACSFLNDDDDEAEISLVSSIVANNIITTNEDHNLRSGDTIRFDEDGTGGGLDKDTDYYVGRNATNEFSVHEDFDDAVDENLPNKFALTEDVTGNVLLKQTNFTGTTFDLYAGAGAIKFPEYPQRKVKPNYSFRLKSISSGGKLRICFNYAKNDSYRYTERYALLTNYGDSDATEFNSGISYSDGVDAFLDKNLYKKGDCEFIELDNTAFNNKIRRGRITHGHVVYYSELIFLDHTVFNFADNNSGNEFDYPNPQIKDLQHTFTPGNEYIIRLFYDNSFYGLSVSSSLEEDTMHEVFIPAPSTSFFAHKWNMVSDDFWDDHSEIKEKRVISDARNSQDKPRLKQISGSATIDLFTCFYYTPWLDNETSHLNTNLLFTGDFGQTNQNSNCFGHDCIISDGTDWTISGDIDDDDVVVRPFKFRSLLPYYKASLWSRPLPTPGLHKNAIGKNPRELFP